MAFLKTPSLSKDELQLHQASLSAFVLSEKPVCRTVSVALFNFYCVHFPFLTGEGDPEEPMVKHHSIPEPPMVKRHSLEPSFRRQRLSLPMHDEMPMSARTERRRSTGVGVRRPRGVADAGGGGAGGGVKVGSWKEQHVGIDV